MARVQTGVRIEKRLLKVLKALAEYHEMTLGGLLETIVLHAFEGTPAFDGESLEKIAEFERIYGLEAKASDSAAVVAAARSAEGGTFEGALAELSRLLDPES